MKKHVLKIVLSVCCLAGSIVAMYGQDDRIEFEYDAAGNRVSRTFIEGRK